MKCGGSSSHPRGMVWVAMGEERQGGRRGLSWGLGMGGAARAWWVPLRRGAGSARPALMGNFCTCRLSAHLRTGFVATLLPARRKR